MMHILLAALLSTSLHTSLQPATSSPVPFMVKAGGTEIQQTVYVDTTKTGDVTNVHQLMTAGDVQVSLHPISMTNASGTVVAKGFAVAVNLVQNGKTLDSKAFTLLDGHASTTVLKAADGSTVSVYLSHD